MNIKLLRILSGISFVHIKRCCLCNSQSWQCCWIYVVYVFYGPAAVLIHSTRICPSTQQQ